MKVWELINKLQSVSNHDAEIIIDEHEGGCYFSLAKDVFIVEQDYVELKLTRSHDKGG